MPDLKSWSLVWDICVHQDSFSGVSLLLSISLFSVVHIGDHSQNEENVRVGYRTKCMVLCKPCGPRLWQDIKALPFTRFLLNVKRRRNQKSTTQGENALQDADTKHRPGQWCNIKKLFEEYSDAYEKLQAAKLRAKQLEQMKMENQRKGQWLVDRSLDELNPEELLALDAELTEFIEKLKKHRQERLANNASSTSVSAGGSNASPN